jgi:hypothetical protein
MSARRSRERPGPGPPPPPPPSWSAKAGHARPLSHHQHALSRLYGPCPLPYRATAPPRRRRATPPTLRTAAELAPRTTGRLTWHGVFPAIAPRAYQHRCTQVLTGRPRAGSRPRAASGIGASHRPTTPETTYWRHQERKTSAQIRKMIHAKHANGPGWLIGRAPLDHLRVPRASPALRARRRITDSSHRAHDCRFRHAGIHDFAGRTKASRGCRHAPA